MLIRLAEEFSIYMNYVRRLGFEETPDYDFLRLLFSKVLKNVGEPDDGVFDWMFLNGGKGLEVSERDKVSETELLLCNSHSSMSHTSVDSRTRPRNPTKDTSS